MEGALKVLLHKPWLRHAAASLLLAILVSSLTLLFASDQGGLPIYYEGVLSFWADYDAVFLPAGLNGLYFDTSDCEGCHDTLVWNRASKSYKVVKDGAQFFDLRFPPYVDLELALVDLKAIKGISHCSRIPIPYPDAASE